MMRLLNRLLGDDPRLREAERVHRLRVVDLEHANEELKRLQQRVVAVGQQAQEADAELAAAVVEADPSLPVQPERSPDATRRI